MTVFEAFQSPRRWTRPMPPGTGYHIFSVAMIVLTLAGGTATTVAQAHASDASPAPAYYVAEFQLKDPEGIKPYSANVAATSAAVWRISNLHHKWSTRIVNVTQTDRMRQARKLQPKRDCWKHHKGKTHLDTVALSFLEPGSYSERNRFFNRPLHTKADRGPDSPQFTKAV